ncbi:MAG: hypothetical protein ABFS10_05375 [Bacteroidota bacterium]
MKQMMKIALGMMFALGLASCDMFNVDVDTTLSGELDIVVEEGVTKSTLDAPYEFADSVTIDPGSEDDISEYTDQIVGVAVENIYAVVSSVSETGVSFLAGSTFYIYNSTDSADFPLPADWPIVVDDTLTLDDVGGSYSDVADILENIEEPFTLKMTGTSSHEGVTVTITVDVESIYEVNLF